MKIIMQTRGDMRRFRTHKLFFDFSEMIIVCHTVDQVKRIANHVQGIPIIPHGLPEGVTAIGAIRDWIEGHLVQPDEWYAGIDDNINHIFRVKDPLYSQERIDEEDCTRENYRMLVRDTDIQVRLAELRARCEAQGTIYGGFGWMENPLFRRIKWQAHGYAKAKLYVKQNVGLKWQWDPRIQVMYDHAQSFKVIQEYGSVAVNRFVYVDHPQYEVGGIGSHAERMPFRKPTQDFLYEYFDGLIAPHKGNYDKPVVRLKSQKTIDRWRELENVWR